MTKLPDVAKLDTDEQHDGIILANQGMAGDLDLVIKKMLDFLNKNKAEEWITRQGVPLT